MTSTAPTRVLSLSVRKIGGWFDTLALEHAIRSTTLTGARRTRRQRSRIATVRLVFRSSILIALPGRRHPGLPALYNRFTSAKKKNGAPFGAPFLAYFAVSDYSVPPFTPGRGSAGKSSSSAIENTFGNVSAIVGSGSKPSGCAMSMSTS